MPKRKSKNNNLPVAKKSKQAKQCAIKDLEATLITSLIQEASNDPKKLDQLVIFAQNLNNSITALKSQQAAQKKQQLNEINACCECEKSGFDEDVEIVTCKCYTGGEHCNGLRVCEECQHTYSAIYNHVCEDCSGVLCTKGDCVTVTCEGCNKIVCADCDDFEICPKHPESVGSYCDECVEENKCKSCESVVCVDCDRGYCQECNLLICKNCETTTTCGNTTLCENCAEDYDCVDCDECAGYW